MARMSQSRYIKNRQFEKGWGLTLLFLCFPGKSISARGSQTSSFGFMVLNGVIPFGIIKIAPKGTTKIVPFGFVGAKNRRTGRSFV